MHFIVRYMPEIVPFLGSAFFATSISNSLQKSSAIQKISVTLLSVIMIQYLLFGTSKLLNISEITKRIGNFFKLPIQLFYSISYPELALLIINITMAVRAVIHIAVVIIHLQSNGFFSLGFSARNERP